MKPRVRVSIVIPAYNEESYLPACLDAIAAQTVQPFEVIVVDNNSTDRTAEIARSYPFVRLIREPRQGHVFANAAGLNAAMGDALGRIDADTQLSADWVAVVAAYFERYPAVAAVTGKCYFGDMPLRRLLSAAHAFLYHYVQKWVARSEILWGSNMAIRREVWQTMGVSCAMRADIDEDIDLSIRLTKKHYKIRRIKTATAIVSLRRGKLGPRELFFYLQSWPRNYSVNKQFGRSAVIYAIKTLGYILILPISVVHTFLHQH